jgi:hypothetical protein
MADFNKELCDQKHWEFNKKLDEHHNIIAEHYEKLKSLEIASSTQTQKLADVCKSLDNLAKSNWGLFIVLITSLVGFFFYCIQHQLFK